MQHAEVFQYDISNHWPIIGMDFTIRTTLLQSGCAYWQPHL